MPDWILRNTRAKQKGRMRAVFVMLFVLGVFGVAGFAMAQGNDAFGLQAVGEGTNLGQSDIRIIIANIIRVFLGLIGIIMLVLILYAGFTIQTSAGNPEKVQKGKQILTNAVIGLVITLSAFAITSFIISRLAGATGFLGGALGGGGGQRFDNFAGSGSLGRGIIVDVNPSPGAKDVPRNTGIFVTFREPINPSSIIENTNNTCWGEDDQPTSDCPEGSRPYFGDCMIPAEGQMDPQVHCDRLRTDRVIIDRVPEGERPQGVRPDPGVAGVALTSYEGEQNNAFTFVFKPFEFLGDEDGDVEYFTYLTNDIVKTNGDSAFINERSDYYEWEFTVTNVIDLEPPVVIDVYPGLDEAQNGLRNSIIQATFSEPILPIAINKNAYHTAFGDADITGEWRLSNGYRTIEFISDVACGQNSCGDVMFCLPVPLCEDGAEGCVQPYEVAIRTATLRNEGNGTFEAIPGTGFMDGAWNALDGRSGEDDFFERNEDENGRAIPDGKPIPGLQEGEDVDLTRIGDQERVADTFWWNFGILNEIDRTPPYISRVIPDIDTSSVSEEQPLEIYYSERMWIRTVAGAIDVVEYPANVGGLDDLSYVSRSHTENGKTVSRILHRAFGPNGLDLYYFPTVSSTAKDAQQNCLYPGVGPNVEGALCEIDQDGNRVNCTNVQEHAEQDTSCVTRLDDFDQTREDILTCLDAIDEPDVSPLNVEGP